MYGLREALAMIREETLDCVWDRHATLARSVHAAVDAWAAPDGLELHIVDPDARSNAVTTIRTGGIDGSALRDLCEERAGLTLGIGLAPYEHLSFRIGHMGHVNPPMLLGTLGTIEAALIAMDAPMGASGAAAAATRDRHRDALRCLTDYADLLARVDAGDVVVIDGGTGTEIQRRGVAMDGDTWCAEANIEEPDVVRDVHASYVDAGAELIIANTYATSPLLFDHLGRGDDVERIDRLAVELARQASDGRVPVGGSISVMRPVVAGGDRNEVFRNWTEDARPRPVPAQGGDDGGAGADVLVMEMMRDTDYSVWATEAAIATGLPVWVGIAVERGPDGELVGASRPDCSLEAIVDALAPLGPDLIAIMHSSPDDTGPALDVVRSRTDVRLGAYPESGYFEMPNWRFVEIDVDDLVSRTRGVDRPGGAGRRWLLRDHARPHRRPGSRVRPSLSVRRSRGRESSPRRGPGCRGARRGFRRPGRAGRWSPRPGPRVPAGRGPSARYR